MTKCRWQGCPDAGDFGDGLCTIHFLFAQQAACELIRRGFVPNVAPVPSAPPVPPWDHDAPGLTFPVPVPFPLNLPASEPDPVLQVQQAPERDTVIPASRASDIWEPR